MDTVKPCVINPDDYLETQTGRPTSWCRSQPCAVFFAMIEVPSPEEGFIAVWSVNHPGEGP